MMLSCLGNPVSLVFMTKMKMSWKWRNKSSSRTTVLDCERSIIRKGSIFIPSKELCTENGMPTEQFSTLQYFLIWRKRHITLKICVCFLHIDVHWNRKWVILLTTVQPKFFMYDFWTSMHTLYTDREVNEKLYKGLINMVITETWLYNYLTTFK